MQDAFISPGNNDYLINVFLDPLNHRNLVETIQFVSDTQPDITAFVFIGNSLQEREFITYRTLDEKVKKVAAHLQEKASIGDRVLLIYQPGLDFIIAFLACLYSGMIAVPVHPPINKQLVDKLQKIISNCTPSILLSTEENIKKLKQLKIFKLMYKKLPIKNFAKRFFLKITSLMEWDFEKLYQINTDKIYNTSTLKWQPVSISTNTIAFLQYTSGSTGKPKGVMVSHANLIANIKLMVNVFKPSRDAANRNNISVSWLPPYHDMGLIGCIMMPLCVGVPSVLMSPLSFIKNPLSWLQLMTEFKATHTSGPNFSFEYCAKKISEENKRELNLTLLQSVMCGAEPIFADTLALFYQAFKDYGFKKTAFIPCYGLAEATLCVSAEKHDQGFKTISVMKSKLNKNNVELVSDYHQDSKLLVSCGKLVQAVKIVNPMTLRICDQNEVGEIWVTSDSVAIGYWNNHQKTNEAFHAHLTEDTSIKYLRTGDLGFIYDNELYITGRIKDLIIIHGTNYYPQDIEKTISKCHKNIQQGGIAAFSLEIKNEERLVVVCEVIANTSQSDYKSIQSAIVESVAKEHQLSIHAITLIPRYKIPKTSSGKMQRFACKAAYLDHTLPALHHWEGAIFTEKPSASETACPPDFTLDMIREWLVTKIALNTKSTPEAISLEQPFTEFGIDSVVAIELSNELGSWLGRELSPLLLWEYPNILTLSQYLSESDAIGSISTDDLIKKLMSIPQINKIVTKQNKRELVIDDREIIDFASCNYLGMDYEPEVLNAIPMALKRWGVHPSWTRAVASPYPYIELEKALADLIHVHDTLVFPNVAMLNFGILPLLAGEKGVILSDNTAHHTIHDACDLAKSHGTTFIKYQHNDFTMLEKLLEKYAGRKIVLAVDGVYSMSVAYLDVPRYVELAKKYQAFLYIDDAHGFGIIGENATDNNPYGSKGNGIANYYGLNCKENNIFYVAGLSKAYSSHAAFISCHSDEMKSYFQRASTYIFSGPVPVATLSSALTGLLVNKNKGDEIRQRVYSLTKKLLLAAKAIGFEVDNTNYFPIIFVVIGDLDQTIKAATIAWEQGLLITPGVFPAVPLHRGGLRFSITSLNTEEQIDKVINTLSLIHSQLRVLK